MEPSSTHSSPLGSLGDFLSGNRFIYQHSHIYGFFLIISHTSNLPLGLHGVLFECQSLFSICDLSLKNLHLYLNLLLYLYFSLYISMYLCSEMAPPGDLFERQSFGETNIIADPQSTIRLTLRHLGIFKNIYRIFKAFKKNEKKYC